MVDTMVDDSTLTQEQRMASMVTEMSDLRKAVTEMEGLRQTATEVAELKQAIREMEARAERERSQGDTAAAMVKALRELMDPPPSLKTISAYDGDMKNYEHFYTSLLLLFESKPQTYKNHPYSDQKKVYTALSYMTLGQAGEWAIQMVKQMSQTGVCIPWIQFEREARTNFGDPDMKRTALLRRKMEGMTADEYIISFDTISPCLLQDDEALMEKFESGLAPSLNKAIYHIVPLPKTLEDWKDRARTLDRQDRQQRLQGTEMQTLPNQRAFPSPSTRPLSSNSAASSMPRPSTGFSPHYFPSSVSKPSSGNSPSLVPRAMEHVDRTGTTLGGNGQLMDLDAARRMVKCFNCGRTGHIACSCPNTTQGFNVREVATHLSVEELRELLHVKEEKA